MRQGKRPKKLHEFVRRNREPKTKPSRAFLVLLKIPETAQKNRRHNNGAVIVADACTAFKPNERAGE